MPILVRCVDCQTELIIPDPIIEIVNGISISMIVVNKERTGIITCSKCGANYGQQIQAFKVEALNFGLVKLPAQRMVEPVERKLILPA